MKKAKLIFGILALTIFSLSFVSNYIINDIEDTEQAIKKSISKDKLPTHG